MLKTIITSSFFLLLISHSTAYAEWFKADRAIMGTAIHVELWHTNKDIAETNIQHVIDEMHRIDELMSPYKQNSEVSSINNNAAKHPVSISIELFNLIKKSIHISELSKGAFDITFASVGYLYDYRHKNAPTKNEISKRIKSINYKNIQLDPDKHTIFFTRKNTRIDLGGIAKGHAVDNAIKLLQQQGIQQAMVSAGGDTRIIGDKKGRPWYIGIRHPRNKKESAVILPLSNTAISTSGDYERYFIKNNTRYHHIINPRTGDSARELRSVSILGPNSTMTDALSTTVFILGLNKGMKLVSSLKDIEAIIIDNKGKMYYSTGLKPAR